MNNYTVEQLIDPDDKDMAAILNLFRDIPGRTCSAAAYLSYLNANWQSIAIFVGRDKDGKIVGFTQAESPGVLDPNCAWLPFSNSTNKCPHRVSVDGMKLAVEWMKGKGAVKFKMVTVRKPEKMRKVWGMHKSKETLMVKEIA